MEKMQFMESLPYPYPIPPCLDFGLLQVCQKDYLQESQAGGSGGPGNRRIMRTHWIIEGMEDVVRELFYEFDSIADELDYQDLEAREKRGEWIVVVHTEGGWRQECLGVNTELHDPDSASDVANE